MDPIVKAVGVRKSFGTFEALKGIDLEVDRGEVTCIIGPSGSGKSTFLRCINQLESIDEGVLWVNGELVGYRQVGRKLYELSETDTVRQRLATGMVFQRFNLFPHMTALQNVMEGPVHVLHRDRKEAESDARALLKRVGLAEKYKSYPIELSGGQQQRVAIARALAMKPALMLFDEPTSALDPELVGEVLNVMRDLAKTGMTMIVVTHELGFAREVASQVLFMDQGQVIEAGPPTQVLGSPRQGRTRDFISAVLI
jgi:polar amino acid transport system ATP-binding protein